MQGKKQPGILLIVDFDWPQPFEKEHAQKAWALHDAIVASDWVVDLAAGAGGVGAGQSSIWVFRLDGYAALDRLMREREDPVCRAYMDCFGIMENVAERVREEVIFL
jgi:hypothetical protein